MHSSDIGKAVENIEQSLQTQSDPGPRADLPATAIIEDGLRCRIEAPDGSAIYTDMPESVGGSDVSRAVDLHSEIELI